jgi:hypothetical protein
MKLTGLLASSLLPSFSRLISATEIVNQSTDVLEKLYLNAAGEVMM